MREDIELKEFAEKNWWTVIIKHPHESYEFVKNDIHVWYCRKGWARARLDEETYRFTDHEYFPNLKDALER